MSRRHPRPTRADHQRFCEIEGWTEVRNATGRRGHHVTYELALPDGRILRTRISHPPDRSSYGPSIWSHILRDQLAVTADEFWACVRDRSKPWRGAPTPSRETIPAAIVRQLIKHGMAETDISKLTRQQAIDRASELWSQGP